MLVVEVEARGKDEGVDVMSCVQRKEARCIRYVHNSMMCTVGQNESAGPALSKSTPEL